MRFHFDHVRFALQSGDVKTEASGRRGGVAAGLAGVLANGIVAGGLETLVRRVRRSFDGEVAQSGGWPQE